jgi:hypothetical protein
LRVSEKKLLREIFGIKKREATGEYIERHTMRRFVIYTRSMEQSPS